MIKHRIAVFVLGHDHGLEIWMTHESSTLLSERLGDEPTECILTLELHVGWQPVKPSAEELT